MIGVVIGLAPSCIPDPLRQLQQRRSELGLMAGKGSDAEHEYCTRTAGGVSGHPDLGTVISYALYTVLGSPSPWLLLTLPYVLYGIFRYIFLVTLDEGEEPADTLP